MGMFDTLRCDYPLPDPEFQERTFHTQDLRCLLDHYHIDTEGRLRQIRRKLHVTRDNRAVRPAPESEDTHYHGDIRFHAKTARGHGRLEYRARFTHGLVEWIRREEEEAPASVDSLEALARDAKDLEQERQARLEAFFQRLEVLDAEVAQQALETFGDRDKAAYWLGKARRQFGDQSPYEMLAQGQRREVLDTFFRIDHGFFA